MKSKKFYEGLLIYIIETLKALIYFRSVLWATIIGMIAILRCREHFKYRELIKKEKLKNEFNEFLKSINIYLKSGENLERAFKNVLKDFDDKSVIYNEISKISLNLENGMNLKYSLTSFLKGQKIEEVDQFRKIIIVNYEKGGNFSYSISSAIDLINEKNELNRERHLAIARKRFEANILILLPYIIIILMYISANNYMSILSNSKTGRILTIIAYCLNLLGEFLIRGMVNEKI
jgi:tight adherence protein B